MDRRKRFLAKATLIELIQEPEELVPVEILLDPVHSPVAGSLTATPVDGLGLVAGPVRELPVGGQGPVDGPVAGAGVRPLGPRLARGPVGRVMEPGDPSGRVGPLQDVPSQLAHVGVQLDAPEKFPLFPTKSIKHNQHNKHEKDPPPVVLFIQAETSDAGHWANQIFRGGVGNFPRPTDCSGRADGRKEGNCKQEC